MKNPIHRIKHDKAFRYRLQKWFWISVIPIWWFFLRESVMFVNMLSLVALIIGSASAESAAEAAENNKD